MLRLAEETQVFDFPPCVKFHASSFRVMNVSFIVPDMNEILSFAPKFLSQNVDYLNWTIKHPYIHNETFK